VDGAPRIDPHPPPPARLQPPRRQRPQQGQLLGQPRLPAGVELAEQPAQEGQVVAVAGEVAAAAEHQRLAQRPLELAVALLDVAVLVGAGRVDRLPGQAVVPQQRLVAALEDLRLGPRRHRRGQAVGAVDQGHAAQFPQGVLEPLAEALEALGKTDRSSLPIGVSEHEVVDQVRERRPRHGHAQVVAVGKVAGAQPAGVVDLAEEHLLGRPVQRPPALDPPLEGAELAVGEAAGVLPLQVLEQGLGLQAGVDRQQLLELGPDVGEGVGPRPPVVLHADLAGQLAKPPVLARCLVVHAGPRRGQAQGNAELVEAAEPAHLRVGDHPKPPGAKGFGQATDRRGPGSLMVADGDDAHSWTGNRMVVGRAL
jgi:hypothetical protein